MSKAGKGFIILAAVALMAALLSACGGQSAKEPGQGATRSFTDWTGHTVQVPDKPERIIFHGETTGDLAALGINPVGILLSSIEGTIAEEKFKDAEDVGFPFNVEKATSLNPDLIIFGNSDEAQYEFISKVATTVTFDTFASLDDRLRTLGQLFGKEDQAEQWLADYHDKEAAMWQRIREGGIGPDETATVFTMYPGDRLFVMANTGLSQILYGDGGLKPTALVRDALDAKQGFIEISLESIPEYAGDHIFLLTPVAEEAVNDMGDMEKSSVWNSLAAVQNQNVYTFGVVEAYSDAISREWLLEQLPQALLK